MVKSGRFMLALCSNYHGLLEEGKKTHMKRNAVENLKLTINSAGAAPYNSSGRQLLRLRRKEIGIRGRCARIAKSGRVYARSVTKIICQINKQQKWQWASIGTSRMTEWNVLRRPLIGTCRLMCNPRIHDKNCSATCDTQIRTHGDHFSNLISNTEYRCLCNFTRYGYHENRCNSWDRSHKNGCTVQEW